MIIFASVRGLLGSRHEARQMQHVSIYILAIASLLTFTIYSPLSAKIESSVEINLNACAGDATKLGVSRVIEIDTAGGVDVGSDKADAKHFLNDDEVVLTFDDGPLKSDTKPILKALADQCTKATFFMVGQMAFADPEMVKEVATAGHTIGTHTWSHKNIRAISLAKAEQEIEAAISTVSKAKGTPVAPLFRFPYLNATKQSEIYLKSRNIGAVWIDVDSKDYRTRSSKVVERNILSELAKQKKGIILMHDIHAWTAAQLPDLLKELHDRGYKIVHFVPKGQIETVASYNAAAERALAAKAAAAKAARTRWYRARSYGRWRLSPEQISEPFRRREGATRQTSAYKHRRVATKPMMIVDGAANHSTGKIPVLKYSEVRQT